LDKRRKIGIIYHTGSDWIGGEYYFNSIILTLKKNMKMFDIYILSKKRINNSFGLSVLKYNLYLMDKLFNKIRSRFSSVVKFYVRFLRKNFIQKLMSFDVIFPSENNLFFDEIPDSKKIYWVPDFQENYFPDFFLKKEILARITCQVNVAYSRARLILSSNSAYNDFIRLYPHYHCDVKIVPFVSSLCFNNNEIDISYNELKEKYNITDNYFICSNQFWKHKNHNIIIEAASILRKSNMDVKIYFTGKEYDYREPEYSIKLKNRVCELGLKNNIFFLGFIPREDQITLMTYAMAIIQPSVCEGWNTTIEDAKYLRKAIIASDISVHTEQLGKKGYFFNPNNPFELVEKMHMFINKNSLLSIDYSYQGKYFEFEGNLTALFGVNT
jgi:glycosyltransferase involved in cell wall biosynthesis